ncbi:Chitin binding protein [Fictibacillus macauensis ZFHKF-1]|uniref:Chitin binding protein n=1 Tax=Fictibacillus macauensis ZFHKF-1 TaxID=1196324 RepID=I8AKR4_9BACL|nr:lytic polysaccharide monooxygenase [Fictibacillus macauensis]EIT86432.1 Chitin binding protein [Fictibacillus macauensis ZFHKF-1]
MKNTWKKVSAAMVTAGVLGSLVIPQQASAHGYVSKPASRSALCSSAFGSLNKECGGVAFEPQSLEAPKGFPAKGPADGKIASAGGLFGGILDQQTTNRWHKTTMTGGENTFTWSYTAAHNTSQWTYYITKKGWNPNQPLTRASFEKLTTIKHDGSAASTKLSHKVSLPKDRSGYYVILAVWDVADTSNAFYSTIDINLVNNGTLPPKTDEPHPPTKKPSSDQPTGVHSMKTTSSSVSLMWSGVKNADHYAIYRGTGAKLKKVSTTKDPAFLDKGLAAKTTYHYQIAAVSKAGKEGAKSSLFTVKTKEKVATHLKEWSAKAAYKKGDRVTYKGKTYEATKDYEGHGDSNWIHSSLWKVIA